MVRLSAASVERGQKAEEAFKKWLRRTKLGYMVVDQTPFSVPIGPERLKRPDFLVGILSVGMIAIDAKGRNLVDGHAIIEVSEYEGFSYFERYFGTPVWYAWYPNRDHLLCYLFRNSDLRGAYRQQFGKRTVFAVPLEVMTPCKPFDEHFDYALFVASRSAR
jgi:hypothetical protein